jgi:hypothetical protein
MSETEAITGLVTKAISLPQIVDTPDGKRFLVKPQGWTSEDVTVANTVKVPKPQWINQSVDLQTVPSLIDYINRYKTGQTVIFADLDENNIVAAIDYHNTTPGPDQAERVEHRAELTLRSSEEWSIWTGSSGRMMKQAAFARFLTENSMDVVLPGGGANLHEIVLDLEGEGIVRVKKQMRTAHSRTGTEGAQSSTDIKDKDGNALPPEMIVRIPVFLGEASIDIRTFLVDNLSESGITLGYQMSRLTQHQQAEVQRIVEQIGIATDCKVFIGRME